jgi:HSP20 family protein
LLHLQERVNRLFDESLARSGARSESEAPAAWRPPVDLYEQEDRYVLRADLPGMDAGTVDVQVDEGDLVLRGNRRSDASVPRESYLRLERPSGGFTVRIGIPPSVDGKRIEATHRNGVLEVVLPKKREEPHARIPVSTS